VSLGGREITADSIKEIISRVAKGEQVAYEYFGLKQAILPDLVPSD